VILALVAFASIVLAEPNFRGPLHPIWYPRLFPIRGRLYGRQVDSTATDSAHDILGMVPVAARPIPGTPAAAEPIDLPPGAAGIPDLKTLG
jgi:hypothetical protein